MEIRDLLIKAHESSASDIHITVGSPPVYRINGELRPLQARPLRPSDSEKMIRDLIGEEGFKALVEQGEYDSSIGIAGVSRFRLNCYRQRACYAMVARVIPSRVPSLHEMGLPPVLKTFIKKHQGLVLVCGPTGSGKSTTLAAMINEINQTMRHHIVTLENPIEYLHNHASSLVNQREVGFDTHSFSNGLRASLRQDPDVILVGEMRDAETTRTVITAAETGHLVFATLHTMSAVGTIERIVDVFPHEQQHMVRSQLANVLVSIISQRLFRRADGSGRIAAQEIMVNTPAIANQIRMDKLHQVESAIQTGASVGMQTMAVAVSNLVKRGLIRRDAGLPYMKRAS